MAGVSFTLVSFLLFCSFAKALSDQSYGLCSQVFLMQQYCSNHLSTGGDIDDRELVTGPRSGTPRIGKAGPRGLKGDRGDPAVVDYTAINKTIFATFREIEARIDKKMERLLNSEAEKRDSQIESLRNKTERLSSLVEKKEAGPVQVISDCKQATQDNAKVWDGTGGVFFISRGAKQYQVYCDITTDGGGWTVFQRRVDGSEDFYRTWEEYAVGFGNVSREFWLGLENLYQLTQDGAYELRVDLTDWDGSTAYAKYRTFSISARSDNYRLTVGGYSGTAGDSMTYSNNRQFSAKDRDLDGGSTNCATDRHGASWYGNCADASLNGIYNETSGSERGVYWFHWKQRNPFSLKASEMKFRKK